MGGVDPPAADIKDTSGRPYSPSRAGAVRTTHASPEILSARFAEATPINVPANVQLGAIGLNGETILSSGSRQRISGSAQGGATN